MRLWLARDLDGMLFLYTKKPKYHSRCEMFFAIDGDWINLSECNMDDFPEVTVENSPMEVEIKLIEKCKELL